MIKKKIQNLIGLFKHISTGVIHHEKARSLSTAVTRNWCERAVACAPNSAFLYTSETNREEFDVHRVGKQVSSLFAKMYFELHEELELCITYTDSLGYREYQVHTREGSVITARKLAQANGGGGWRNCASFVTKIR